jgi:hypothetical protein
MELETQSWNTFQTAHEIVISRLADFSLVTIFMDCRCNCCNNSDIKPGLFRIRDAFTVSTHNEVCRQRYVELRTSQEIMAQYLRTLSFSFACAVSAMNIYRVLQNSKVKVHALRRFQIARAGSLNEHNLSAALYMLVCTARS